jgi:hypothetical protein
MPKLNYLLPRLVANQKCPSSSTGQKQHHWAITTNVKSSIGDNVAVEFVCERCGRRHTEFFSKNEYELKIRHLVEEKEKNYVC